MKVNIKTISVLVVLALVICLVVPVLNNISLASGSYTVTIQASDGHTLAIDAGHLKIDNCFVELQAGQQAIGEVAVNGNTASITVSDGTPGSLNYQSNDAFTIFYTQGHTQYNHEVLDSDTVLIVENYSGSNTNNDTIDVSFATETFAGNLATFNLNNEEVTLTVVGGTINNGTLTIDRTNLNSVSFTLGNTFNSETMEVYANGEQNYRVKLAVNNSTCSLGGLNIPGNGVIISIDPINNNNNEPQDPPPGPQQPQMDKEITTFEFTINGQALSITNDNQVCNVPQEFDFENITDLSIQRIVEYDHVHEQETTYTYQAGEYTYNLKDSENRTILETHLTAQTSNLAFLRIESHVDGITEETLTQMGKDRDYFYSFYMPQIVLVKPNLDGLVQISTENMPDVYDFVSFNGIELGDTSADNYGEVTVYYGNDTVNFGGYGCNVTKIELVEGMGVPTSAVEINNNEKTIKVKSNFYNEIYLKVTALNDNQSEVVGYIKVVRVGIYINDLAANNPVFYHGAFNGHVNENGGNAQVDLDKNRLVAVFYHDNTTTINDYDLIVNIVYKDGTRETKLAKPMGDVADEGQSPLVGSDFILFEADSWQDFPAEVCVTAVKKGATSTNGSFGGATFGAGAGVTWVNEMN